MQFVSTRGQAPALSFSDAVLTGLARDGGLYVPVEWPVLSERKIRALSGLPYQEVALRVMRPFIGASIPDAELARMIGEAYAGFGHKAVVPLVQLGPTLQLEAATDEDATFVMVIQVGERRYGLVVADVLDTEEIVVKPLATILRDVDVFSGATILGDGSVVLILDPNALSERAGNMLEEKQAEDGEDAVEAGDSAKVAMLLFKAGGGAPKAVELEHITRLEHVEVEKIERMDGRAALQYRGKLMPILGLNGTQDILSEGIQPLLVFTGEGYAMGLAVDEIVDVVEDRLQIELSADRPGVRGTAVVSGRACEILDVDYYHLQGLAEHQRRPGASSERAVA